MTKLKYHYLKYRTLQLYLEPLNLTQRLYIYIFLNQELQLMLSHTTTASYG